MMGRRVAMHKIRKTTLLSTLQITEGMLLT